MIYSGLKIPRWIEHGVKHTSKRGRVDRLIYGADTETLKGQPMTLQFYSEHVPMSEIMWCKEAGRGKYGAMELFLDWCDRLRSDYEHVVYIHNLAFDIIELFWGVHERFKENGGEYNISADGWDIRGIYGAPTYCSLRKGSHRIVHLVDSWSYYRGSLATAAALYCPTLPKLQRPVGLGTRYYSPKNNDFVSYAMRDAQVSYHIGVAIDALHREFDIPQSVSIADLAARVYRSRYLDGTIPQTDKAIIHASMCAYHGGKNNITADTGWYRGVHSIDVSSAYPAAMRELPAFADANLYKPFRRQRTVRSVPPYGVYCVSGSAKPCSWPSLFSHGFKPLRGRFELTWIQGQEVNAALESGELQITSIHGYYYDHEKDGARPSLAAFCDEFYGRKQSEPDKVKRYGYKLILNSISGKFIQTRKRVTRCVVYVDGDEFNVTSAADLVAGGLFHPFIAAAITAHTRARIHALEHHYAALHTATDGIFTRSKPDRRGQFKVVEKATRLGDLENDYSGNLLLLRNKLYILYGKNGKRLKYALHGFQGKVETLEELVDTHERSYSVTRANRLKESLARGLDVNDFRKVDLELKVGAIAGEC